MAADNDDDDDVAAASNVMIIVVLASRPPTRVVTNLLFMQYLQASSSVSLGVSLHPFSHQWEQMLLDDFDMAYILLLLLWSTIPYVQLLRVGGPEAFWEAGKH